MLDVALINQHQVVDQCVNDCLRQFAGRAYRNALGNAAAALRQVGALDGVVHGRETRGLHTDDLDAGLDRPGGSGHPGDQSAAANGHHQGVKFGHIGQHFQGHRALPGHNVRVIVRVHKNQVLRVCQFQRVGTGRVQRVTVQHYFSTKTTGALDLDTRGKARHDDHRTKPQALRVVSHTLRVVAGTHGNDAARTLLQAELRQLVAGTALLERRGELQVFELQEHLRAGDVGKRPGSHTRGAQQVVLQAPGGALYVSEFKHGRSPVRCNIPRMGDRQARFRNTKWSTIIRTTIDRTLSVGPHMYSHLRPSDLRDGSPPQRADISWITSRDRGRRSPRSQP